MQVRVDDADALCVCDAVTAWLVVEVEEPVKLGVVVLVPVFVDEGVGAGDLVCVWDGERVKDGVVVWLGDPVKDAVAVILPDCESVQTWEELCDTEGLCDCVPIVPVWEGVREMLGVGACDAVSVELRVTL